MPVHGYFAVNDTNVGIGPSGTPRTAVIPGGLAGLIMPGALAGRVLMVPFGRPKPSMSLEFTPHGLPPLKKRPVQTILSTPEPLYRWTIRTMLFSKPTVELLQMALADLTTTTQLIHKARKDGLGTHAKYWEKIHDELLRRLQPWVSKPPDQPQRGRRKGSVTGFSSREEFFDFIVDVIREREAKGLSVMQKNIAAKLDQSIPTPSSNTSDRDLESTCRRLRRLIKKNGMASWDEMLQFARTSQKKMHS
jgi:hypothetical protein